MEVEIRLRRDIAARWTNVNPVLGPGEPGLEKDTKKLKIGDGEARWNDLPYYFEPTDSDSDFQAVIDEHINSTTPHPIYDDGPSLQLLYENAKV